MERKRLRTAGFTVSLALLLSAEYCLGQTSWLSNFYPNKVRLTEGTLLPPVSHRPVSDLSAADASEVFAICNIDLAQQLVNSAKTKVTNEDGVFSTFNAADQAGNRSPSISAHYLHFLSDNATLPANTAGRVIQYILLDLLEEFANRSAEFQSLCLKFVTANLNRTQISSSCGAVITCDPNYPYRTSDGSCNNLLNPTFGKSNTRLQRFTASAYRDGVGAPRSRAADGRPLPSARQITNWLVSRQVYFDNRISHMVMQWGQFLDHDLSVSPMITAPDGTPIVCCAEDLKGILNLTDREVLTLQHELDGRPECLNIPVPRDDQRFRNRTCINFVRSSAAPPDGCAPQHREQLNSLTSYVDASMIYGSTQQQVNSLRSFNNGLLRVQKMKDMGDLMPTAGNQTCHNAVETNLCFIAGDSRSNEQPGLASIHTIFVREHNRIASKLVDLNPGWSDETVFQETRRIIIAVVQHITFNDFLPVILGSSLHSAHGLAPLSRGYYSGYNNLVDASVRTEFSTIAFRFGHTLLRDCFSLADRNLAVKGCFLLRDNFFKPDAVYNGTMHGPDGIMRGLLADRAQRFDRRITPEVVDHLFTSGNPSPLDLPAFNIQRARDHGIPPYVEIRRVLGMSVPATFDDLNTTHDDYEIYLFKRVYTNVSDIDGFVGGVSERPLPDAMLGPMFAKIIALQMVLAKTGDRFYYESDAYPSAFTEPQLAELRKASLTGVLCDNIDIARTAKNPFFVASHANPWIKCSDVATVDLRAWKV